MKVAELQGAELDVWAARAAGEENPQISHPGGSCYVKNAHTISGFRPSEEWRHGGPIIERERINLFFEFDENHPQVWHAMSDEKPRIKAATATGETPLIAAMRCYVAFHYGPEVPDDMEEP